MNPALLATVIDRAGDAIAIAAADGVILYVNRAVERMTGFSAAELVGRTAREALGVERTPPEVRHDLARTLAAGRVWRGELAGCGKDGMDLTWQTSVTPVAGEGGGAQTYLAVFQDASARQDLEARLRQSQKMEAVGRLAGGIAHDFNNLLTVIAGYADQLEVMLAGQPAVRQSAEAIKGAVARASGLTRQLLAFSRRQVLAPRPLDVNAVVADMSTLLRRLIGGDVRLVLNLARGSARARADRNQLEQVVMNLAINARDAMPQGGTLTIETAIQALDASFAALHAGFTPGRYVVLSVQDDGCGMTADTMSHLFEPFFTTKEEGKGTGLGLSTTYGIVKQSDGYIYASSEPGKGSRFTVCLPHLERAEEEEEATAAGSRSASLAGGGETLLVVDDEERTREFACRVLRGCGYLVLEATDGAAGLSAAERYGGAIDLVVTDLLMPRMNGRDMAGRIRQIRPATKVLFTSGEGTPLPVPFLAKPFTADQLSRSVRGTLDGKAPASS